MEIMALFEGLLFGLLLSIMIGPVFLVLLQTSIEQGKLMGLSVALGALVSDLAIMSLIFFGFINMEFDLLVSKVAGILGVFILILIGFSLTRKPAKNKALKSLEKRGHTSASFAAKGFLINSLNPFVFVFWGGVLALQLNRFQQDIGSIIFFCLGIFISIFGTDILKVFLSNNIRKYMNASVVHQISTFTGITLIFYGILLLYQLL